MKTTIVTVAEALPHLPSPRRFRILRDGLDPTADGWTRAIAR